MLRVRHGARSMTKGEKPRRAARLGLVGIDRKSFVVAPTGMRNLISASAN